MINIIYNLLEMLCLKSIRSSFFKLSLPISSSLSSSSLKYGIETMTLLEQSIQDTSIERSIYNGCRSILTNNIYSNNIGKNNNDISSSVKKYEILIDLVNDDININDFNLCHKLNRISNNNNNIIESINEIITINDILKPMKRSIDYVSIPLDNNNNNNNNIKNYINSIKDNNINIDIGIDINTDYILKNKNIINILDNHYNTNSNDIKLITISTNYMTSIIANDIIHWANNKGLKTISTDILNISPQRPGILSASSLSLLPSSSSSSNGSSDELQKAVDDLKRSMDTCMLSPPPPPPPPSSSSSSLFYY